MEGLFVLGVIIVGAFLLGLLAVRYGVDSRPGSGDPRQPEPGLTV